MINACSCVYINMRGPKWMKENSPFLRIKSRKESQYQSLLEILFSGYKHGDYNEDYRIEMHCENRKKDKEE